VRDDTLSFRDHVAAYFKARPGQWIDLLELGRVGGCYAARTRISEVRRELGFQIDWRKRRVENAAGGGVHVVSEYRYSPSQPADRLF